MQKSVGEKRSLLSNQLKAERVADRLSGRERRGLVFEVVGGAANSNRCPDHVISVRTRRLVRDPERDGVRPLLTELSVPANDA